MTAAAPRLSPSIAHITTWLFDLDNTLYPASSSVFPQIDAKMKAFIGEFLGLSPEDAFALQKTYYREYGTTLRGLMLNHGLEPDVFLDYVHDVDHSALDHDAALRRVISALPGRRLVFTNGTVKHADRVLEKLGLQDLFEGTFDIRAADFIPKPQVETYHRLMDTYGIDPTQTAFFEDSHVNLKTAAALGMTTVLVRSGPDHAPLVQVDPAELARYCHHVTDDLALWLADALTDLGITLPAPPETAP